MSDTLNWVITAVLIAAAAYGFYAGAKKYSDFKKDVKKFMEVHPDAKEYSFQNWLFYLEIAFGIIGFVLALVLPAAASTVSEAWVTRILYLALGLLVFGMALDTYVHHRLILCDSGFFYEDAYTKFRSILKLVPSTGRFKPTVITITNSKEIMMNRLAGLKLEEAYKEWKENKKASRGRKKKGRQEDK